jgi:wyosine [tRNA(Phe)-imidazoG37] synthetase (radical SAM superfamily)
MLLELQSTIIYGPIRSRRIGSSLGVNLLPPKIKICSFDCLYCQYGWTDFALMESAVFPGPDEVRKAIEDALEKLPEQPHWITFSGNGEATLHPDFGRIVDIVIDVRDRFVPDTGTAILSNSTTVHRREIREALAKLDLRIMKLDAGTEEMFASYSRPASGFTLDQVVDGLAALDDVTIQSLFTKGTSGNFTEANMAAWIERLKRIEPLLVQVYSLDRGFPSREIEKLSGQELDAIVKKLEEAGIPARAF